MTIFELLHREGLGEFEGAFVRELVARLQILGGGFLSSLTVYCLGRHGARPARVVSRYPGEARLRVGGEVTVLFWG
jgi:hypothetical protein